MIHDGEGYFPNSCVEYVEFNTFPLRERFAKLREHEELLQKDLEDAKQEEPDDYFKIINFVNNPQFHNWIKSYFFLQFVEAELCWMAVNLAEDYEEDPIFPERRRNKKKEPYISKQISIFEPFEFDPEDFETDDFEELEGKSIESELDLTALGL